jgi:cell division protease FtsH
MKSKGSSNFVYLIIIAAVLFLVYSYISGGTNSPTVPLNQVAADANAGKIASILVRGDELSVTYQQRSESGEQVVLSRKGPESTLIEQLQVLGVDGDALQKIDLDYEEPVDWGTLINIGVTLISILAGVAFFYLFIRQFQGANNQALSFGKSKARMFSGDRPTVTFDDVAGVEEAKEELKEVVEFLKEPQKFINLGARIPKGVLLVGAPGTGKTLMAKAVAGEAGVPFFSISGSEFVEMFVGVGASRVRDLFDQAKRHSPCIVFVDEIDAVGRYRGAGLGGSHDEREQTLNQILVEMDGFDTDTNVIVVAATNRPDILDPALLRPGRFDRRVVLDQPDIRGREAIFRVHTRGKPVSAEVDLEALAQSTPGFVGADIENAVNEAAILAARRGKRRIGMSEFQEAIERVIAGPERRSRVINDDEREVFAYHEAGHAVVAYSLPKCDPVRKISIVARGMAGGYTLTLPEEDHYIMQRGKMLDEMAKILGGRAAEEVVYDEISTGASDDLEKVSQLARNMVMRYGMSDELGPLVYGRKEELVFLGKEIGEQRDYSEAMAEAIDKEVRNFVISAHDRAKDALTQNREKLDRVARALLERETLSSAEFEAVMQGRPLPELKDKDEVKQPQTEPVLTPSAAAA